MTVSNVLSTFVTAGESKVTHAPSHSAGAVKSASSVCEGSAALADNAVSVFFAIPVDANVISLRHASDDLGNTGTTCIGLYPGNIDPSALVSTDAVDEDCFAVDLDAHTGAIAMTDRRYSALNIDTCGKKAWELGGLSAKPDYSHFWVCTTVSTGAYTSAGTEAMDVTYI